MYGNRFSGNACLKTSLIVVDSDGMTAAPPIRILLVEDDLGDQHLFQRHLQRSNDVAVEVQAEGTVAGAVDAIRSSPGFDVAFIDFGLPDAQGVEVIDAIQEVAPDLPLVVLTGHSDEQVALAALRAGAQDYLLKGQMSPINMRRIMRFAIERKSVTERLRLKERELRRVERLKSTGELAAGVAHEINTPLQYVGDNLFFLEESMQQLSPALRLAAALASADASGAATLTEQLRGALADVDVDYLLSELPLALSQTKDGLGRVTDIVRAMKEFSHPGSDEKQEVDVQQVIDTTLMVSRNEWKYVATAEARVEGAIPRLQGYPGELSQVVLNLVVNAAHAIKEVPDRDPETRGRIDILVRADESADSIVITVTDTGAGMSPETVARCMEPDFTTKGRGVGTGQGLALVQSIVVARHGGRVSVESELGSGTAVTVELPTRGGQLPRADVMTAQVS